MRDRKVLIQRLQSGLQITNEEREYIRRQIMRNRRFEDRYRGGFWVLFVFCIALTICLAINL